MKLIQLPITTTEAYEMNVLGRVQQYAGRKSTSNVLIAVPDQSDAGIKVWNTLKYGPMPDLHKVMMECGKIERLIFDDDDLVLYGVIPVEMNYDSEQGEAIYRCAIDYYEVLE